MLTLAIAIAIAIEGFCDRQMKDRSKSTTIAVYFLIIILSPSLK